MSDKKQPSKYSNSTTFSKTNQPVRRSKGQGNSRRGKSKHTLAQDAMAKAGFNPTEIIIAMTQKIMELVNTEKNWAGQKIKPEQKEAYVDKIIKNAEKLLPYQSPKPVATPLDPKLLEADPEEEEPSKEEEVPKIDPSQPLDMRQLAQANQDMVQDAILTDEEARAKADLESKL